MDEYTRIEKIGEGTYGVVYKAKKTNGRFVPSSAIVPWSTSVTVCECPCNGSNVITLEFYLTFSGDIVALKKIPLELEDQGVPTTAIREISTLRELQHENVVKYVY